MDLPPPVCQRPLLLPLEGDVTPAQAMEMSNTFCSRVSAGSAGATALPKLSGS